MTRLRLIIEAMGLNNAAMVLAAAVAALTVTTVASAASSSGLGGSFASASANCGSRDRATADFGASPVSRDWGATLARITTTAGFKRIEANTGDGETSSLLVTGGADTTWMVMPRMFAGLNNSIWASCIGAGAGSLSAELYELPTAPANFAGALTQGAQAPAVAEVAVRADRGGQYYANLTLQQGAVSLKREAFASPSPVTFASSGRYDLGINKAGELVAVHLEALDGPQAKWQIEIVRTPATVTGVAATPTLARQGAPVKVAYSVAGDTRVSANVLSASGKLVRSLGADFAASVGPHTLTWDGMDNAGRPVKDGAHKVMITTDESTAGEATVVLDSTSPAISRVTPARLASKRALVVRVSDTTSGVRTAQLKVDGTVVRRLAPGTSSLLYRPAGGWRAGSHQASVTATDGAGNRAQTTLRFSTSGATAQSPMAKPYKAACMDKGLKVRPTSCLMAPSRDASFAEMANLAGLRWSSWGGSRAVGSGYELGMHLPFTHIPVQVVLTKPAFVEELGIHVYKHFRVTSRYGTLEGTIQAG